MRTLFIALYCIGVLLVALLPGREKPFSASNVAKQKLPANHYLRPADIAPGPSTARYLVQELAKDGAILPSNLGDVPAISLRKGAIPAALPVPRTLVEQGGVNADMPIRVCDGKNPLLDSKAQAVICGEHGQSCIVVFDIEAAKATEFSQKFTPAAKVVPGKEKGCG